MAKVIAKDDTYIDSDGKLYTEPPAGAFLLARAGRQVPHQFADLFTKNGSPKKDAKGEPPVFVSGSDSEGVLAATVGTAKNDDDE